MTLRPELAFVPQYQSYFQKEAGVEHYRLLEDLVVGKTGVVIDIGTLYGSSALALASNADVNVWSYDITDHIPRDATIRDVPNISFRLQNGIEAIPDFVSKTDLILLDVDPHDGIQEKQFFDALVTHGYTGIVVCDDIHLNDAMRAWWASIDLPKEDVTHKGHFSGTGIVTFRGASTHSNSQK